MLKLLKKYFIPHTENEHKPHFLRRKMILYLAGIVLFVEVLFLLQNFVVIPRTKFLAAILPDVLIDETNKNRQTGNLALLTSNPLLEKAAALKARDMAEKGYFAHVSPDNRTPWYWFGEAGYAFSYAGENLAVNFVDSKDVTEAWMNSPGHRANILKNEYTEIGIGTAQGTYQGRETIFIVQLFGRPSAQVSETTELESTRAVQETETVETSNSIVQEAEVLEISPETSKVLAHSSVVEQLASSPKTVVSYFYGVLSAIILLALLLTILIKINIQHPRLIVSAILLIVCIGIVILLNEHITISNAKIF